MIIYLTKEGRKKHEEELLKLHAQLQDITTEKNYAYNNCGDTWHDNPTFNELEQKERRMVSKVTEKQNFLNNARIIEINERDTNKVAIGSIVKLQRNYLKTGKNSIEVWEIVGFGESEPKNKKIGYNTPLGNSILGLKINESKIIIDSINGNIEYKIIMLYKDWEDVKS
jgi:transcription elongation factor GreA